MLNFPVLLTGPVMPLIEEGLAARFPVTRLHEQADSEAFLAAQGASFFGLVPGSAKHGRLDGKFLSRLPNLKIVGNFGVGYDGVDAAWAGANGVVVTNTPDVLTDEVADLALALLLATIREIPQSDLYLRQGKWLGGAYPLTTTLRGRRMGILGLGRIGKAIARRAAAFDVPVSYHGRQRQADVDLPYFETLTEMARAVDILMIVTPGGPSTYRLVNAAVLEALGPNGIVINVSRGTVIDEPALIEALQQRKILAAGLDVFEHEPKVPAELIAMQNVVLLPHIGSASVHTRNQMGQLVVDNIISFAEGKGPLTPVPETPWPPRGAA